MWDEDCTPMATMSDAHAEWHRNTGVPMGQPGCPQDACDGDYYDEAEASYWNDPPELREGEQPVPYYSEGWREIGPEVKWWVGDDDQPPF